ncbi:MAG: dephospho-CoA kinase [Candidatus Omnitrophota bacterium]|nr:dephospho-CoA kinase [Candidatus Omnitrophota bacterium]
MKKRCLHKKIVLGVTGSLSSGKTTVAGMLRALGAEVIDADRIAHELILPGKPAHKEIVRLFGKDILKKNEVPRTGGSRRNTRAAAAHYRPRKYKVVDRKALGRLVFCDKRLLKKLDQCLHPRVIALIKKSIRCARAKVVVLDAPLLLEAGLGQVVDKLIVVTASRAKQMRRARIKMGLEEKEITSRITAQIPLEEKAAMADFIIDNNGSLQKTRRQVTQIWRLLWKN